MKKIFRLNANLAGAHLRRHRKLSRLTGGFPLQVTWVSSTGKGPLSGRQPYILLRRHADGILRRIFMFARPWPKKVKSNALSILRWEDDGGGS